MKFGQNGTDHGFPEVSNYKKGHLGNPFGCTQKSAGKDEVGLQSWQIELSSQEPILT